MGMDTKEVLARFASERQAFADHAVTAAVLREAVALIVCRGCIGSAAVSRRQSGRGETERQL